MTNSEDLDDDFPVYDDNIAVPKKEIVRKLRSEIPREHRASNDTRLMWLWSQRLAVVQNIRQNSPDIQDVMACTLVLSAAMASYLPSIELLLRRLEGGSVSDQEVLDGETMPL